MNQRLEKNLLVFLHILHYFTSLIFFLISSILISFFGSFVKIPNCLIYLLVFLACFYYKFVFFPTEITKYILNFPNSRYALFLKTKKCQLILITALIDIFANMAISFIFYDFAKIITLKDSLFFVFTVYILSSGGLVFSYIVTFLKLRNK